LSGIDILKEKKGGDHGNNSDHPLPKQYPAATGYPKGMNTLHIRSIIDRGGGNLKNIFNYFLKSVFFCTKGLFFSANMIKIKS
jgi:hypothetical protein